MDTWARSTSTTRGDVITKRDVYGYEVTPSNWKQITLTLYLQKARANVEFRFEASDQTIIAFDYVRVDVMQTPAPRESTRSIDYRDLNIASSQLTADGTIVSTSNGPTPLNMVWFGPYLNLPPGNYTITYYLKPTNSPKRRNHPSSTRT